MKGRTVLLLLLAGIVGLVGLVALLAATAPEPEGGLSMTDELCPRLNPDYRLLLEVSSNRRSDPELSQSGAQRTLELFVSTDIANGLDEPLRENAESVAEGVRDAQDGSIADEDFDRYINDYRDLKEEAACATD